MSTLRSCLAVLVLALFGCPHTTPPKRPLPEASATTTNAPEPETRCDAAALTKAAASIEGKREAWTPAEGQPANYRDEAVAAILASCPDLPPALRTTLVGEEDTSEDPAYEDLVAQVCPEMVNPEPEVIEDDAYGLCGLERFGVVTREEFVHSHSQLMGYEGHVIFLWLLRVGVPPAAARVFAREDILGWQVVGDPGLQLPVAPDGRTPDTETETGPIAVGPKTIAWRTFPPMAQTPDPVPLDERGRVAGTDPEAQVRELTNFVTSNDGTLGRQPIVLHADRRVPLATVYAVVQTVAELGTGIDVAVVVPDRLDPVRRIRISDRAPGGKIRLSATLRGSELTIICDRKQHNVTLTGDFPRNFMCGKRPGIALIELKHGTLQDLVNATLALGDYRLTLTL